MKRSVAVSVCVLTLTAVASLAAQRPALSDAARAYVSVDAPVIALVNARVIDGTGAPARDGQTVVIRGDRIASIASSSSGAPPEGAQVIDLAGKSVIPGLVMMHEHLYYPVGPGVYGQLGQSFIRLYLAGGVTTMRTGGNMNGFMDINLRKAIDEGRVAGPALDATAPYVNGPNTFIQMRTMADADEARRQVAYWADMGATSFKAY
ncbi:MAG: amidohydrolase, partial [Acidobacteria bacterium]|nr:amidohydrolase [Acidobacteriota bacterium]